jgi:hypothetical protein
VKKKREPAPAALDEAQDYYLENGRMVFTAAFLKRRGFCCQCGCRHCPYGFNPENLNEKSSRKGER